MKYRKLMLLLLSVALSFALAEPAGAAKTQTEPEEERIILLHTNDVHGAIEHYGQVAALKQTYEAEGAYVLLLDAGDFIQGDPAVNLNQGAAAVELMNLCGYDAVALGNHEFDYGYENIRVLSERAGFPMLAANVRYEGRLAFGDRVVFTSPGGTKIGVFGLDTPETATKAHPGKIRGVTFLGQQSPEDLFRCAQKQTDALRAEGCQLVVCLGHLGTDMESMGHRSIDVLDHVTGIDILIDGHSHSTLEEVREATGGTGKVGGAYVTSTGTKLESIGKITITGGQVTEVTVIPTEGLTIEPEKQTDRRAREIRQEIDQSYGQVFARTEVELDGVKKHVRTGETNLSDLVTDAMLWEVRQNGIEADAVVTNGGGIRASIPAGGITKKDINTVLPFANELCIVTLTGAELQEVLEAATFCAPEAIGGFPQLAGMEVTLHTAVPYDAGAPYPGSTYARPASLRRVEIHTVGGEPFDPKREYSIVTNDFLADGGDTYYRFKSASRSINLGFALDEVVMRYITEALDGTVTVEAYGQPERRMVLDEEPAETLYVVRPGDSLWKIARRVYGHGTAWGRIYDANRSSVRENFVIYPGQTLTLPAA